MEEEGIAHMGGHRFYEFGKEMRLSTPLPMTVEHVRRDIQDQCFSLKNAQYVHRKCVQRWCNEKGDSICEICLQQFKPGYTGPPPLFHFGNIPMNFRRNWEEFSRDFHESQFITMVPTDHGAADYSDDDYNFFSGNRSTVRIRSVAIIFMTLLVLRHSLPLLLSGAEGYSLSMFSLLVLRIAGILVPVAIIARGLTIFHRRRRQQIARSIPISGSDGESVRSPSIYQPQPLIRVH